jgi:hypothetical protein
MKREISDINIDEDAFAAIEQLDLDPEGLSTWLAGQYGSADSDEQFLDTDLISPDMFDDILLPDESPSSTEKHSTRRRASRSPPRSRPRHYSPERSDESVQTSSTETTYESCASKEETDEEYQAALSKLAASMRRSEQTRSQVLKYRSSPRPVTPPSAPAPAPAVTSSSTSSPFSTLADLITGKRTSLTAGLEQSRRQLRTYMSLMNSSHML